MGVTPQQRCFASKYGLAAFLGLTLLALLVISGSNSHPSSLNDDVIPMVAALAAGNVLSSSAPPIRLRSTRRRAPRRIVQVQASAASRSSQSRSSPVAVGYAAALLETGTAAGKIEVVQTNVQFLEEFLDQNENVANFLANPVVLDETKRDIINKVNENAGFHQITMNFLNLLVDKKRLRELPSIFREFEAMYFESKDIQSATVTSATELDDVQRMNIAKKVRDLTGVNNIRLKSLVDKNLIGGFIVRYGRDGSGLIDMSIKGQVEDLSAWV